MCLTVESPKIKFEKSEEEKTCYKVLIKGKESDRLFNTPEGPFYYTPYFHFFVKLGTEYSIEEHMDWETWPSFFQENMFYVDGGCFHLFEREEDAVEEAHLFQDSVVVKAIVPAGTEYVKGRYGDSYGVAARKVRYEEI